MQRLRLQAGIFAGQRLRLISLAPFAAHERKRKAGNQDAERRQALPACCPTDRNIWNNTTEIRLIAWILQREPRRAA